MTQSNRPHTRTFLKWLIVLLVFVAAAVRLFVPGRSDAQDQTPSPIPSPADTELIDGVSHRIDWYVGGPSERTVTDQLLALAVTVVPEDRISAFPDPALGLGSTIRIARSSTVTIIDWGTSTTVQTWASTVGALLADRAIEVGQQDQINISKNDTIVDQMNITITRVEVTEVNETESISFSKTTIDDDTMEKGQTKLIQAGQNGLRTLVYRVRRENGRQVEKIFLGSEMTKEPVVQETAVGTHVTLYGSGKATWYGLRHGYGAASNVLPYGTKVRVVNAANGKSVDVTIDDHGIQGNAIIDLDAEAFAEIAPLGQGIATVRLEKIYGE